MLGRDGEEWLNAQLGLEAQTNEASWRRIGWLRLPSRFVYSCWLG
jgi:hypothetical protein